MAINPSNQSQKDSKDYQILMQDNAIGTNIEINKEIQQYNNDFKCHYCFKEQKTSFSCKQCQSCFCLDCINQIKTLQSYFNKPASSMQDLSNGICFICLKECPCSKCNSLNNNDKLEPNCLLCNSNKDLNNIDELLSKVSIFDEKKKEVMQDIHHPISKLLQVAKDKRVICQQCRMNNELLNKFLNEMTSYSDTFQNQTNQSAFTKKDIMNNIIKSFKRNSEPISANANIINNKDNENKALLNSINVGNNPSLNINSPIENQFNYSGNANLNNYYPENTSQSNNFIPPQQLLLQLQQLQQNPQSQQHQNQQHQQQPQMQSNPFQQFINNTLLKLSPTPSSYLQQGKNTSLTL